LDQDEELLIVVVNKPNNIKIETQFMSIGDVDDLDTKFRVAARGFY
jgi:hypothetical protein